VTVVFDRVEHWRKPRVLCLAASETPPALDVLVASLRTAISARKLPFDERPYRPHVTLARHVARFDPIATNEPLRWHADSFALVESRTDPSGARYVPLASWLLDPSAGAA
jgi:2'-5' RNA ligase